MSDMHEKLELLKESDERENVLSQELQSLGMDYDVLVQYIESLEKIIRYCDDPKALVEMEDMKDSVIDVYGNIPGLSR